MARTAVAKVPNKIPISEKRPAFDLASRYAADSVEVTIYDPSSLAERIDTGLRIRIKSLYSKEARDAALAAKTSLKLVDGEVDASDADFESNLFEQTIGVTMAWWVDGETTETLLANGKQVPCTPATVREVYSDPRTQWVQKQVQAAYLDLARFFGAPKTA